MSLPAAKVAFVALSLVGVACAPVPPAPPLPERPNILLVTVDTLRWDRTSLADASLGTTPFLERWSRDATVYERAYSTSSWTVPAIASLLTGLDPAAHGLVRGSIVDGAVVAQEALAGDHVTLAEQLRERGYRTFAVTSNSHLQPEFGFAQGFDRYDAIGFRPAGAVNRQVRGMLGEIHAGDPWFVWVHYFDPHAPYRGDSARLDGLELTADERRRLNALQGMTQPASFFAAGIGEDPQLLEWLHDLYDDEVRRVDAAIGGLFEMLDVSLQELVVVTSDHGEEFLDHGALWHGHTLYEELVRIPLVVRFPGGEHAGLRLGEPVALTDLLPTALAAAGAPPLPRLHGVDLKRTAAGEGGLRSLRLASEKTTPLEGMVDGTWKYIHDPRDPRRAELYRLDEDPAERHDLSGIHASSAAQLRDTLAALRARHRAVAIDAEVVALAPERLEALRSVGYVALPRGE